MARVAHELAEGLLQGSQAGCVSLLAGIAYQDQKCVVGVGAELLHAGILQVHGLDHLTDLIL